jgi:hypothetical protein
VPARTAFSGETRSEQRETSNERAKTECRTTRVAAEVRITLPLGAASNGGTNENKGEEMIKKVLVTVVAAGALSVPLAGVAGADPSPTNPGVPGYFGTPPGAPSTSINTISDFAHAKPAGEGLTQYNNGVAPGQVVNIGAQNH